MGFGLNRVRLLGHTPRSKSQRCKHTLRLAYQADYLSASRKPHYPRSRQQIPTRTRDRKHMISSATYILYWVCDWFYC